MEYCPILIEIIDQTLKAKFMGNFLLQLWSIRGDKIYERVL
jgi:hypothetical protein